jgi:peptidoglycan/xylan/chitin deacetylase (PgdA/CDA1 family)
VRWFGLGAALDRHSLTGVMWTAIGRDWKAPADAVARRLVGGAGPGAILCLHDGRVLAHRPDISATIGALERLLPTLAGMGYHFQSVTEISCPTNSRSA